MIRSENEGEIIPPFEELGGVREAAGSEPGVVGPSQAPRPGPSRTGAGRRRGPPSPSTLSLSSGAGPPTFEGNAGSLPIGCFFDPHAKPKKAKRVITTPFCR